MPNDMSEFENYSESRPDISAPQPLDKPPTSEVVPMERRKTAFERGGGGPGANELARRMLALGIDLNDIKDQRLKNFINRVGNQPTSIANVEYLRKQYDLLDTHQGKADLDPGLTRFDDSELASVLAPLNEWIEEIDTGRKPLKVKVEEHTLFPDQETPEAWTKIILGQLDLVEKDSERRLLRSFEDEDPWKVIDRSMAKIPDGYGRDLMPADLVERRYFEAKYPKGFHLKERLQMYVEARRHINDRYLEIIKANGSLTAMGLGKDEVPFEGISYKLQSINGEDMWMIYHADQLFPELSDDLRKELAPNVSEASEKWLEIGIVNKTLPRELLSSTEQSILDKIFANKAEFDGYYKKEDKEKKRKREIDPQKSWPSPSDVHKVLKDKIGDDELILYANIPTFDNSRNVSELMADIRARLVNNIDSLINNTDSKKGEDLAWRMLTVWLTLPLLDRNRTSVQGSGEDRDLMWGERKRVFELGDKEREPGVDWTVGRYFVASPDQGSAIKDEDAKSSTKLRHRKDTLEINAERGVLIEKDSYFEGEVVSDYLHNNMIFDRDELAPGKAIRRNMASYVINADGTIKKDGFRNIPYLQMGQASYSGYFGYTLGKAKQINADLSGISWKDPKEMGVDDFWNKKRDLIERMEHISPRFITREFQFRGKIIRERLLRDGRFDPNEVAKIAGYSEENDLEVITDPTLRREARTIILDEKGDISKAAEDQSKKFWASQSAKIRMIHAMGQVWTGSLDGVDETSNLVTQSSISPNMMQRIITAITVSRYLEGEYLEQFKYEAWKEMGFGVKWGAGRRKRYRLEIDPSWWD